VADDPPQFHYERIKAHAPRADVDLIDAHARLNEVIGEKIRGQ
jgi:hypothetical protein